MKTHLLPEKIEEMLLLQSSGEIKQVIFMFYICKISFLLLFSLIFQMTKKSSQMDIMDKALHIPNHGRLLSDSQELAR